MPLQSPYHALACLPSPYPLSWDRLPSHLIFPPSLLFSKHLIPNGDQATEMSKDLTLSQALGVMAPEVHRRGMVISIQQSLCFTDVLASP